ncbi:hypothetical protein [Brevibacillus sp. H7]|uniref:hypothetical protein n=1 Tax=Brevibacillus sp. H7 TaxID=3349138 RepID=UPI003801D1AB
MMPLKAKVDILHLYNDAKKSFEPISISERKEGEEVVVIGTETNELNHTLHQAKGMLIWRKENNEWKLLREYIELER